VTRREKGARREKGREKGARKKGKRKGKEKGEKGARKKREKEKGEKRREEKGKGKREKRGKNVRRHRSRSQTIPSSNQGHDSRRHGRNHHRHQQPGKRETSCRTGRHQVTNKTGRLAEVPTRQTSATTRQA